MTHGPLASLGAFVCATISVMAAGPSTQPTSAPTTQRAARPGWVPSFNGPWDDSLTCLTLKANGVVAPSGSEPIAHAAAPTICRRTDGALAAFFEYYSFDRKAEFGCIASAESRDGGKTWTPPRPVDIEGLSRVVSRPRQPSAIALPDNRVRLYFTMDRDGRVSAIASAVSTDGRKFQLEPEPRLALPDGNLFDATAVQVDSDTHLFARMTGKQTVLVHAVSADGLRFSRLPDVRLEVTAATLTAAPHGVFIATQRGARFLASSDGSNWALVTKPAFANVRDIAATQLERDSWLLLVVESGPRARSVERWAGAAGGRRPMAMPKARPLDQPGMESGLDIPSGADLDPLRTPPSTLPPEELRSVDEILPPPPDFREPIDYAAWIQERGTAGTLDNAAPYYEAILVRRDETGRPVSAVPPLVNMLSTAETEGEPRPWSPADYPEWERAYQESSELLARYREATQHADFGSLVRFGPADGESPLLLTALLPDLSAHRAIVKQVLANGWRAEDGRIDPHAMMDSWATALRSANHLSQGFTLIEQLVGAAEIGRTCEVARQALAQGVIPPEQLPTALQVLRDSGPTTRDPAGVVAGELAFALDIVQFATARPWPDGAVRFDAARIDRVAEILSLEPPESARLREMLGSDPAQTAASFRGYYAEIATLMRQGYPEVRASTLEEAIQRRLKEHPAESFLLPQLGRYHKLRARNEAAMRATQLAYAVQIYRSETGSWPTDLDELPPDLAGAARIDPFTGGNFGYRVGPDGPIIYSASENGIDDGGLHAPRWDDERNGNSDDFVFWPPQPRPPRRR